MTNLQDVTHSGGVPSSVKVKTEESDDLHKLLVASRMPSVHALVKHEAETVSTAAAPKKRIRYFVEAVEIIVPRRQLNQKMIKWRNPKMKRDENMVFGVNTILSRITQAGISLDLFPTNCEKALQDVMIRRDFMVKTFGGNGRMTFPSIRSSLIQEHGYDNFMYICPQWQPIAPEVPGAPGLWLTIDEYNRHGQTRRLFTRISKCPALWQYQGQYELRSAQKLTKEEWGEQPELLRNTWSREMCSQGWGIFMRTRIYGRKYWGRTPTKEECNDIASQKLYDKIQREDVALALTRGEEALAVYTMKCVGYDIRFQREVAERYAQWVPKQEGAGSKRGKKRKKVLDEDTDDEPTPPPTRVTSPSVYRDEDINDLDSLSDLSDLTDIE